MEHSNNGKIDTVEKFEEEYGEILSKIKNVKVAYHSLKNNGMSKGVNKNIILTNNKVISVSVSDLIKYPETRVCNYFISESLEKKTSFIEVSYYYQLHPDPEWTESMVFREGESSAEQVKRQMKVFVKLLDKEISKYVYGTEWETYVNWTMMGR